MKRLTITTTCKRSIWTTDKHTKEKSLQISAGNECLLNYFNKQKKDNSTNSTYIRSEWKGSGPKSVKRFFGIKTNNRYHKWC